MGLVAELGEERGRRGFAGGGGLGAGGWDGGGDGGDDRGGSLGDGRLFLPCICRGGGPAGGWWRGLFVRKGPSTALRAVPLPRKTGGGNLGRCRRQDVQVVA